MDDDRDTAATPRKRRRIEVPITPQSLRKRLPDAASTGTSYSLHDTSRVVDSNIKSQSPSTKTFVCPNPFNTEPSDSIHTPFIFEPPPTIPAANPEYNETRLLMLPEFTPKQRLPPPMARFSRLMELLPLATGKKALPGLGISTQSEGSDSDSGEGFSGVSLGGSLLKSDAKWVPKPIGRGRKLDFSQALVRKTEPSTPPPPLSPPDMIMESLSPATPPQATSLRLPPVLPNDEGSTTTPRRSLITDLLVKSWHNPEKHPFRSPTLLNSNPGDISSDCESESSVVNPFVIDETTARKRPSSRLLFEENSESRRKSSVVNYDTHIELIQHGTGMRIFRPVSPSHLHIKPRALNFEETGESDVTTKTSEHYKGLDLMGYEPLSLLPVQPRNQKIPHEITNRYISQTSNNAINLKPKNSLGFQIYDDNNQDTDHLCHHD